MAVLKEHWVLTGIGSETSGPPERLWAKVRGHQVRPRRAAAVFPLAWKLRFLWRESKIRVFVCTHIHAHTHTLTAGSLASGPSDWSFLYCALAVVDVCHQRPGA